MSDREDLRQAALEYHERPIPGKLSITPTKQLVNQHDLALAYSPGVAAASEAIAADPLAAYRYTSRGNLVAVISNGTAVLGLGAIGPLAAKPVMEGKAVLFKKFAGIDVFDIEIAETDPGRLVDIIASLEPTFGGINLEDIKAPECFEIERALRARMRIPVFHDDQHGTAIVVGAAVLNALEVVGKQINDVKLVVSGAGAAALACVDLLVDLGLPAAQVWLADRAGVVRRERKDLDPKKARYAQDTELRTLAEAMRDADVFLGLSTGGVVTREMVAAMVERPIVLALANPIPEIMPEEVRAVSGDAVIATGRSDYPNQVNNVLCFPYIFRGALDCGATTITREMEIAAVRAIASLAKREQSSGEGDSLGIEPTPFGPDYIIPKPFDARLILTVAPAVARAAMQSGVAARPIPDLDAYARRLQEFVFQSGTIMKPVFDAARRAAPVRARIIFAEGEDERVLRAAQLLVDEGIAQPILVGRPGVIESRLHRLGLRLQPGKDFTLVNTEDDPRYREYWQEYRRIMGRRGITDNEARLEMRRRTTLIGAMLLRKGEGDGLICGTTGTTSRHLRYIEQVLGHRPGYSVFAAMNALILPGRQLFIVDTHVNLDPTAEELAEIVMLAAEAVRRFGIEPRVALLSHSNFGTSDAPSALKMRRTLQLVRERAPAFEIDGEMHGDAALDPEIRTAALPDSTLHGQANLLVLPNLDAANIAYNLLKTAAGGNVAVGPILLGCAAPVHILTPSTTVRRIVNMTALTVTAADRNR